MKCICKKKNPICEIAFCATTYGKSIVATEKEMKEKGIKCESMEDMSNYWGSHLRIKESKEIT